MQHDYLIYEQPSNEFIRICLRLECLFGKIQHYLDGKTQWDSHDTLDTILKIIDILDRPDCKSKFVQDIQRHRSKLTQLRTAPQVDQTKLQQILTQLETFDDYLQQYHGKLACHLRHDEFLHNLQQQLYKLGGIYRCEAPFYHAWLQQPIAKRQHDLFNWLHELTPIQKMVQLILHLTRANTCINTETAQAGFYQQALDQQHTLQLIRIKVPKDIMVYPELSIGRHRLVIRFMQANLQQRAFQTKDDIVFELIRCHAPCASETTAIASAFC